MQHPGSVAPNHLVTGLQRRLGWPDGDPEPAPAALPPLPSPLPDGGAGITVAVIDTGWPSQLPPDLDWFGYDTDHATAPGEVDQAGRPVQHVDQLDADHDGYLDVEAGHGIFVAGLIRRMAPRARLVFLKALNSDGVGTELGVARAIRFATARGVDIINLSLGFYTVRDATPSGVERAVADARSAGIALVAAAGNDGLELALLPSRLPGGHRSRRVDGRRKGPGFVLQPRRLGERQRAGRAGAEHVRPRSGGQGRDPRPRARTSSRPTPRCGAGRRSPAGT